VRVEKAITYQQIDERRYAMTRSQICVVTIALIMIFGMGTIDRTMAETKEKVKATATSINIKFEKIDVGDEDGHMIAIVENKQVWSADGSDEKSTAVVRGLMDFNPKTGKGTFTGYSIRNYKNGEKWYLSFEGKPAGKGRWEGTHTYNGGTGKYEGMSGSGTWKTYSLAPGISIIEAEGERIYR
jgi:hypothetical protein